MFNLKTIDIIMKRLCLILFLIMGCFLGTIAQNDKPLQLATSTIPNKDAKFLLFPTQNNYIFLKLNTRTGEVSMVQYSTDGKEGEVKIHSFRYPLVSKEEESNGRFFLYPTKNFYNFLLVDQIDGRVWQVQWSFEEENRMLTRIYSDTKRWSESDSILIKDLEYQNFVYYKDGEMFNGTVFLDDEFTVDMILSDGRKVFGELYSCNHKNGKLAFIFNKDDIDDKRNTNRYYDEAGEEINKESFYEKYSELIQKIKSIFISSESKTKIVPPAKNTTSAKGQKK